MGFWHVVMGIYGGGGDGSVLPAIGGTIDYIAPTSRLDYTAPSVNQ